MAAGDVGHRLGLEAGGARDDRSAEEDCQSPAAGVLTSVITWWAG